MSHDRLWRLSSHECCNIKKKFENGFVDTGYSCFDRARGEGAEFCSENFQREGELVSKFFIRRKKYGALKFNWRFLIWNFKKRNFGVDWNLRRSSTRGPLPKSVDILSF